MLDMAAPVLNMASSSRPIAFMLRCRQASLFSSQSGCRKPPQCLEFGTQSRPASTSSQSPTPPTPSTPTRFTFPSQRPSSPQAGPRGSFSPTHRRPTQIRTSQPLNLWTAIKSIFGWKPSPAPFVPAPFTAINNPYRARKAWPPDFTTLHSKHQFHFEKTYRRRSKLKYTRPTWIKGTKIVQYASTVVIVGYWIFFLRVEGKEGTPFDAVGSYDTTLGMVDHANMWNHSS